MQFFDAAQACAAAARVFGQFPIVGRGGTHDIRDLLRLPGVDMAITQDFLLTRLQERRDLGDLKSRLVTIAKLFNEELHVIARQDIRPG